MAAYPESTTSVALFGCPYRIDEFRFDYHKIAKLTYGWRVRVRCPGCGTFQVQPNGYPLLFIFSLYKFHKRA